MRLGEPKVALVMETPRLDTIQRPLQYEHASLSVAREEAMPRRPGRRRAQRRDMPAALSMPFAAWVIVLAAVCLFLAYVILQPIP